MDRMADVPLWPAVASAHAAEVDWLVISFTGLLVLLVFPVFVALPYLAIKYRRGSKADRSHNPHRNIWLEASWTVIPFALSLVFFVWAASLYSDLFHPPQGSLQINVVAKQWMFKFEHPGGQREIDNLHVPAGQPVKLTMISQDVIHSLFLPALRIKRDVLPGRYTSEWFQADEPGVYELFCAEFCGTQHSHMGGKLYVMEPDAYERWLEREGTDLSLAAAGERLFRQLGCSGCHGESAVVRAPPLNGLYGNPVPLASGNVIVADDRYIRDSILLPKSQIAAGYRPIMPSFKSQVSEEDILKLVAYVKGLR